VKGEGDMTRPVKLTKKMQEQIQYYLGRIELSGCYYGKRSNFDERHKRIVLWFDQMKNEQYKDGPIGEIEKFCDDLKSKLIAKFEKGAKEHGDGWRDVNFTKEIGEEIKDIINYHCMFKALNKEKNEI